MFGSLKDKYLYLTYSIIEQFFLNAQKYKTNSIYFKQLHIAEHPSGHLLMRKIIKGESKLNKTGDNSEDNEG